MKNESTPEQFIARDAPYHRAPAGLRERVHASLASEAGHEGFSSRWRPLALAASFALVAMVSWHAALWQERSGGPLYTDEAIDAHVRSLAAPGRLTDVVSSDRHTVKPWFIGKVDLAPPANDFASAGFPLAGGRLDHLAGKPAAALVYRHNAHVVNVFVTSSKAVDLAPEIATRRGYALARWRQDGLAFEAVGDISTEDMNALVTLLRKG